MKVSVSSQGVFLDAWGRSRMAGHWWFLTFVAAAAMVLTVWGWSQWRKRLAATVRSRARQFFHLRREWLEARFLSLAAHSGKPRGLSWADCEFADAVAFATDRSTGQLRAFVAATIQFKALPDGGLEDNPHVDDLREATAVFLFDGREWQTEGRAVFNLNPLETIEHFHHDLQLAE
jgi:hypothetical protein